MSGRSGIGEAPRPGLRRRILRTAQKGLSLSGLAGFVGRRRGANRVAVLMYHSVPGPASARWIAPRNRMDPARFESQMKHLARRRCVLDVDEVVSGGEAPAGATVLTFDDGYRDNLDVVAPILERHGLPAVLYLATGYVSAARIQWADRLYSIFAERTRSSLDVAGRELDLDRPEEEREAFSALSGLLLSAGIGERERVLDEIEEALDPAEAPGRLTLDWDEVRRLRDEYPTIRLGIHTSDHIDLSALAAGEALAEVDRSIAAFEENLGERPRHFSFPYSRVHPEIAGGLEERGIVTAMGGEGVADLASLDAMDVPRLESPASPALFRYLVSGAHPGLSLRLFGRA